MKSILITVFTFMVLLVSAQIPTHYYVELKTPRGAIVIQLLNETPQHRDNFKKLVNDGFYDSLLFHRVIKNFMIQSGDPDSKYAPKKAVLGEGGPEYKIPAEIQSGIFHKRGALGAARDNNPEKQSSASQFYIVQGRSFSSTGLDSLETMRMKGVKFSDEQRKAYMSIGGTPHLDGNYTVFGQTISGLEIVDQIATVFTDNKDRPLVDERINARLLTRFEAVNLERSQQGLKPLKKLKDGNKPYEL